MDFDINEYLEEKEIASKNNPSKSVFENIEKKKKTIRRKLWKIIPSDYAELIDEYCDLCNEQLRAACIISYCKGANDGLNKTVDDFLKNELD